MPTFLREKLTENLPEARAAMRMALQRAAARIRSDDTRDWKIHVFQQEFRRAARKVRTELGRREMEALYGFKRLQRFDESIAAHRWGIRRPSPS